MAKTVKFDFNIFKRFSHMEFGAFEMFGLGGVSIANGPVAMGIRMTFPHLSLGLFDDKSMVMSLVRPDDYAPDLSYVRYSWRVPVAEDAIRRFAKTPVTGNNSPTTFTYAEGEAAEVTLEWQLVEGRIIRGRYTSDLPVKAALFSNGCFVPAEVVHSSVDSMKLRQQENTLHLRLMGNREVPLLAGDRLQAENALLWPGFNPSGRAICIHPLTLEPGHPLYFSMALDQEPGVPKPVDVDSSLASASESYARSRMTSKGVAAGAAEAVAALAGYSRAYDPKRKRIQTTVNRTWGGVNAPGLICGWDNFFTSYIAAWENPALAEESLEHIVQLYSERGTAHGPTQRNLIIPIVYCRTVELLGNLELARRTWPAMMDFMRFWFADRGDGIPWRDGNSDGLIDSGSSLDPAQVGAATIVSNAMDETGYDEIPTYSAGFTDKRRGMLADNVGFDWKSKCLTVSLVCQNSLYVASCRKMSLLAARLGDEASGKWLVSEAGRVSSLIAEKLFDKSRGYFMNRHWNGDFSPVKTLTIFFPLLAGLPDDEVRERLRKALLDPGQFWGENLVPTVSRDEPSYKDGIDGNGNYWRGNCWAPTTYMCWLSAREAGWYDISALIAEKVSGQFMKYWTSFGHAYENYPAEGNVDNSYIYAGGAWGGREIRYVWTALMPLCLLEEIFAVEAVGEGFQFGNPFLSKVSEWNGFLCQGKKVFASAGADFTKVVFGDEWSFESKPGLAVRNFTVADGLISFRTQPLWRDAEIRIKSKSVIPGNLPRVVVNGRESLAVRLEEDGTTVLITLRGKGGKWFQLAVIGDSIVHGGCDSESGGWVARLRLHCSKRGLGDHVFELGLGGNNSRDLLARAESDIRSRLLHTDIVIFGTGTNDMNRQTCVPPEEFRVNLEKLAGIAAGLGKKVGFVGLAIRTDMPPEANALYDSIIKDVCVKGGYLYFPLMDVIGKDDLADSCHPNARGHEKICARMLELLQTNNLIPSCIHREGDASAE